jgi:hypothetical protein
MRRSGITPPDALVTSSVLPSRASAWAMEFPHGDLSGGVVAGQNDRGHVIAGHERRKFSGGDGRLGAFAT